MEDRHCDIWGLFLGIALGSAEGNALTKQSGFQYVYDLYKKVTLN